ncbi:MAG: peptidoglycan DD-metalloendopeptidase family protein [Ginsengibacter sp.]
MLENKLHDLLKGNRDQFHPIIKVDGAQHKIVPFDFTENNKELEKIDLQNIEEFSSYITDTLKNNHAKFGFGGYNELRFLYKRSSLFNDPDSEEPRSLHLGVDIWGDEGTEIFSPLDGTVHSYAFNNNYGDYGATIILSHCIDGSYFFTLYGHLSLADIQDIEEGDEINRGQNFAHFGNPSENGHWPPHLHFQLINDISNYKGDYPGVCKMSEREKYLNNCPDPHFILNMAG